LSNAVKDGRSVKQKLRLKYPTNRSTESPINPVPGELRVRAHMNTPTFTGPAELASFVSACEEALLKTAQHKFTFPVGASKGSWPIDEIKSTNETLLSKLRHQGNVYALFVRSLASNSQWEVRYVGERKADGLRSRITDHLIKKDPQTGSKLEEIQSAVAEGLEIGLSFIKVEPQSLRLFVEERIIANNKNRLPWNSHG